MPVRYIWTIVTYILMLFSGFPVGIILLSLGLVQTKEDLVYLNAVWSIISFCVALLIMLLLLRRDMKRETWSPERSSADVSIMWAVLGIVMVFATQYIFNIITFSVFGVHHGSQNTEQIMNMAEKLPLFIIVVAIIGPIMEEIVFRKIIFGHFSGKFGFWGPAIISSLLFGAAHMDFTFFFTYAAMGMVLCFLYWKTKRIIVPIVAHVTMNAFVVLIQFALGDKLRNIQQQLENMQGFIQPFV